MKRIILPFVFLTALSINASAQEKSNHEKKGDKFAFRYAWDKAINQYTKADELSLNGQRNLAESYRKTDQHKLAQDTYQAIVTSPGTTSEDYYNYAMALKSTGNYAEAATWMD